MNDLALKLDALSDKINTINQNLQFNITIMWVIITFVVATAGVALYSLAKIWLIKEWSRSL